VIDMGTSRRTGCYGAACYDSLEISSQTRALTWERVSPGVGYMGKAGTTAPRRAQVSAKLSARSQALPEDLEESYRRCPSPTTKLWPLEPCALTVANQRQGGSDFRRPCTKAGSPQQDGVTAIVASIGPQRFWLGLNSYLASLLQVAPRCSGAEGCRRRPRHLQPTCGVSFS